jgi:hypothetical protein
MYHSVKNPQASLVSDAAQAVLMGKKVGIVKAELALARALDGEERTSRR